MLRRKVLPQIEEWHQDGCRKDDKNSKQELDFIIEEQNKITVIEVKSGEKYKKHASLDATVKDYTDKIHRSIVLSRYNVGRKDDVLYLPLYMTIFI